MLYFVSARSDGFANSELYLPRLVIPDLMHHTALMFPASAPRVTPADNQVRSR